MTHRRLLSVLCTALLCTAPVLAACGSDTGNGEQDAGTTGTTTAAAVADIDASAASTDEPVVRETLAELVDPPGAEGRTLSLVRYTIAPGAQLPAHIHPGVQMAAIESGTLSYTIIEGTAQVRRGTEHVDEDVAGPTTIELGPGDAVIELADMVHFGANDTEEPIVIVATLLTETGEELAITVDDGS
ncbi:MAG: cupin domain-containing protein [Acidimicrobiia bacterium]|nr:cupin domain-containing protein [Acidimicrobiia bacterium]